MYYTCSYTHVIHMYDTGIQMLYMCEPCVLQVFTHVLQV